MENLSNISVIRDVLSRHGFSFSKGLGQNFLINPTVCPRIAEEGGASVFKPIIGSEWVVGAVGALQFEVMADRIRTEFNIPVIFEPTQYYTARWLECDDKNILQKFMDANQMNIAQDHDGATVFLARNAWHLNKAAEDFPKIKFCKTREQIVA